MISFNIEIELKKIILKTKALKDRYLKSHTNSKYTIDLLIHEILYFLKFGVSWRILRSTVNYKTLFWHYSNWVKNNVFFKLFNRIKNIYIKKYIANNCTLFIDSTIIYNKCGINKIGRNKFYKNKKTTKISLMTDINGFPLSVLFLKGNYHDNSVFDKHITDACVLIPNNNKVIMTDKAYSANKNYLLLESKNIQHIIPPRKNMKIYNTYNYNINEYKKKINLRYDKYLRNFSGFTLLAFSLIGINIINQFNKNN